MDYIEIDFLELVKLKSLVNFKRYRFEAEIGGFSISAMLHWKGHQDRLVVLLPSALPRNLERNIPSFLRWSWSDVIDGNVISIDDPTMKLADIYGGWFQGVREVSAFDAVARLLEKIIFSMKLSNESMIFYGSSIGGFSALCLSTFFPGSCGVAEVPQLDLRQYPVKSAIKDLEVHCYNGNDIESHAESPESNVSVYHLIRRNKVVPNSLIITNQKDEGIDQHLLYSGRFSKVKHGEIDLNFSGSVSVLITDKVSGHKALGKRDAIFYLNNCKSII